MLSSTNSSLLSKLLNASLLSLSLLIYHLCIMCLSLALKFVCVFKEYKEENSKGFKRKSHKRMWKGKSVFSLFIYIPSLFYHSLFLNIMLFQPSFSCINIWFSNPKAKKLKYSSLSNFSKITSVRKNHELCMFGLRVHVKPGAPSSSSIVVVFLFS